MEFRVLQDAAHFFAGEAAALFAVRASGIGMVTPGGMVRVMRGKMCCGKSPFIRLNGVYTAPSMWTVRRYSRFLRPRMPGRGKLHQAAGLSDAAFGEDDHWVAFFDGATRALIASGLVVPPPCGGET